MDNSQNAASRLDDVVELMMRAVYAAFLIAVAVGLLCVTTLIVAVTFAALHKGDDLPGGGGRGGDVIIPATW